MTQSACINWVRCMYFDAQWTYRSRHIRLVQKLIKTLIKKLEFQEQMPTKIEYTPVILEKLNSPYFCIKVDLSKGKNAMCFLSSNISVFPRKTKFSISRPGINLASPNRTENRPFSFDSLVAFIECRKVVKQPTFWITLPCPKKHNYRKIVLIQLFGG